MRRRTTFEDFEELLGDDLPAGKVNDMAADAEVQKPEQQEIQFNTEFIRPSRRPQIPANGSEWFEDLDLPEEKESDFSEPEDLEDPLEYEDFDEPKQTISAEERYQERERRLRKQAQKRRRNRHTGGKLLVLLQIVLSVLLMGMIYWLGIFPIEYFAAAAAALLIVDLFCLALQFRPRAHWFGKTLSLILCAALAVGNVYVFQTMGVLESMTMGQSYQIDKIAVAVETYNAAEKIEDLKGCTFGMMTGASNSKIAQAMDMMNKDMGQTIDTKTYHSYGELVDGLYYGDVDAIIYNESLTDLIAENNPGFEEQTRVVKYYEIKTDVLMRNVPDLSITKRPFVVYLSGMDVYGELEQTSRSDVNMLACVNPKTKQVLLISVPRDAYVVIPGISDGEYDKLTHAGMYGVQYSMDALETVFDESVDYYVRVNFTAIIDVVDALGGIDVDVDYAFTTYHTEYDPNTDSWNYYDFDEGMNHLDGIHALAFARERKNLDGGDYERGRNQQKVITALFRKVMSPAILTGYMDILESLEGCMDTSLSSQQISSLVKMQLHDGAEWDIVSMNVLGYTSDEYCATYSESPLSVEILDEDSVAEIQDTINRLMAGKDITEVIETESETESYFE